MNLYGPGAQYLLVEDDPKDIIVVAMGFKKLGLKDQLHVVHDGHEAMEYLRGDGRFSDRELYPLPDVILLDLYMSRVDGFEFLGWLRQGDAPVELHRLPVFVLSGSNQAGDVNRAYELGANGYLIKPIQWEQFQERVRAIGVLWERYLEAKAEREKEEGWCASASTPNLHLNPDPNR